MNKGYKGEEALMYNTAIETDVYLGSDQHASKLEAYNKRSSLTMTKVTGG